MWVKKRGELASPTGQRGRAPPNLFIVKVATKFFPRRRELAIPLSPKSAASAERAPLGKWSPTMPIYCHNAYIFFSEARQEPRIGVLYKIEERARERAGAP